jgi:hypothetical protein
VTAAARCRSSTKRIRHAWSERSLRDILRWKYAFVLGTKGPSFAAWQADGSSSIIGPQ